MQFSDSVVFKSEKNLGDYSFKPFKFYNELEPNEDIVLVYEVDNTIEMEFTTSRLSAEAKKAPLNFFYLCNSESFVELGGSCYELPLYDACYYRSSPVMEFKKQELGKKKVWALEYSVEAEKALTNVEEHFSIKDPQEEKENVYFLSLKYDENITMLHYYTVTKSNSEDKSFIPNIFEKQLPLLTSRPKFDSNNRTVLLNKFESWILMS